jgi:RNA polymerase sigma factor (sigma-70 family)
MKPCLRVVRRRLPALSFDEGHPCRCVPEHELLREHLPLVERICQFIVKRRCLSADEADEFRSWLNLRLAETGDALLAKFEGRSSLASYLNVVIQRLFLDFRVEKWGKWRPSAAARRLGGVAMRLEDLLYRQGVPFDQAAEMLRHNHGVAMSVLEISKLAEALRQPSQRRLLGDDQLEELPAEQRSDDGVRRRDLVRIARRVESAFVEALAHLSEIDQLILRLRFADGLTAAAIARGLNLDQKALYPRIEKLRRELRTDLQARGVKSEDVEELLGAADVELRFRLRSGRELPKQRPSAHEGGS